MSLSFAKTIDRVMGGLVQRLLLPWRWVRDWTRGDEPLGEVREIVVTKFWGVGNAALLLPLLRLLRQRYPEARLTVVTLESNAPVYGDAADRVLTVRLRPTWRALWDLSRLALRMNP